MNEHLTSRCVAFGLAAFLTLDVELAEVRARLGIVTPRKARRGTWAIQGV